MDRTCELCGKVFKYPSYLKRHKERKTPCNKEGRDCATCGQRCDNRKKLWKHMQIHKEKEPGGDNGAKRVVNVNGNVDTLNVIENVNLNKNDIKINIFTKEDVSHVTAENIYEQIEKSAGSPELLVAWLMREIYRHPANRNACIEDKKGNIAMVLEGEDEPRWSEIPADALYPPMLNKATETFFAKSAEVPCLAGVPHTMTDRIVKLCDELDELCPQNEGPKPVLVKTTNTMGRAILVANYRQLKEMGLLD